MNSTRRSLIRRGAALAATRALAGSGVFAPSLVRAQGGGGLPMPNIKALVFDTFGIVGTSDAGRSRASAAVGVEEPRQACDDLDWDGPCDQPQQRSVSCRGPPPSRRTRLGARGGASRSFRPRSIVLRASPVTQETAARPPQPAARTSLAANNRRPRSSRFEPSASHRCRIACVSIMPTKVAVRATQRNPSAPSYSASWPRHQMRFTYRCGRP